MTVEHPSRKRLRCVMIWPAFFVLSACASDGHRPNAGVMDNIEAAFANLEAEADSAAAASERCAQQDVERIEGKDGSKVEHWRCVPAAPK